MAYRHNNVTDAQILESYRRQDTAYAVRRELGVSLPTIYNVLHANGVPMVWRRWRPRPSDKAIIEAFKRCGGVVAAARELHASPSTVSLVLHSKGIDTSVGRLHITKAQERKALAQYRGGMSARAIAKGLGFTRDTVVRALTRAGVYHPKTSLDEAQVVGLYLSGKTMRGVADALGTTERRVIAILHRRVPDRIRPQIRRGTENANWNGGRVEHHGYVYLNITPDDPLAVMRSKGGYAPEHRIVMARHLGRPLETWETVHHVNGNKTDNRFENLQLRVGKHGKHVCLMCLDCGSRNVGPAPLSEHRS